MQSIIGFFNTLGDFFANFSDTLSGSVDVLLSILSYFPPVYLGCLLSAVGILIVYALLGRG